MHDSVTKRALEALVLAAGLLLGACGGGSPKPTTPDWQPSEVRPTVSQRWWWEPVERTCEDDGDCPSAQRCQDVQLGSCRGCPQGEHVKMCTGGDGQNRHAQRQ